MAGKCGDDSVLHTKGAVTGFCIQVFDYSLGVESRPLSSSWHLGSILFATTYMPHERVVHPRPMVTSTTDEGLGC
jgi:hypothetical protein